MTEAVIVAVITAVASLVGQYWISRRQHEEDSKELAVTLKGITNRLDVHNGYAEKIGGLADDMSKMTVTMAKMEKDIEYLRKGTDI